MQSDSIIPGEEDLTPPAPAPGGEGDRPKPSLLAVFALDRIDGKELGEAIQDSKERSLSSSPSSTFSSCLLNLKIAARNLLII